MLSRTTFEEGWTLLASRFSRVPEKAKDGYWSFLKHKVDDDEFRQAVKVLFGEARSWPTPAQVLEAVPEGMRRHVEDDSGRDPWFQRVSYVLRGSNVAKSFQRQFDMRLQSGRDVPDAGIGPFFFPRPAVEFVDSVDEVRTEWVDREDLRSLAREHGGAKA